MPIVRRESGAKVGWVVYDNEAEARQYAESDALKADRERMLDLGYDFGYCWPGEIDKVADGWRVCTP
jgi:hypothetical protein